MGERKLVEDLEIERLSDAAVLVRKLEGLLVLVSAPAYVGIEPGDAPDIREMVRVVSETQEESLRGGGRRGCSLRTLQAGVGGRAVEAGGPASHGGFGGGRLPPGVRRE